MPKVILGEEYRREDALWEYIDSRIFGVEYKGDKVGTDSIEREDIK